MPENSRARPVVLRGQTVELVTHCGKLYVTVNVDPVSGLPVEVFCRFGRAGGCGSAIMDGMTRMISAGLRAGMDPSRVVQGLAGISCHHGGNTCMNAVAEAVETVLSEYRRW
jgi:hypothetical protein